jgi:hypothetical protein
VIDVESVSECRDAAGAQSAGELLAKEALRQGAETILEVAR